MSDASPSPLATPAEALALVGPYLVGWSFQILFTGASLSTFARYLSSRHYKDHASRCSKCITWFLVFTNLGCCGLDINSLVSWGCLQDRTVDSLFSVMVPDAFGPLPTIVVSTIVQLTYLRRTSLLFKKPVFKWGFVAFVSGLILTSVVAALIFVFDMADLAINGTYHTAQYALSQNLWLWCGLTVDIIISATLCWLLRTRVAGFSTTTDNQLFILIRLAIESASYIAFIALVGGVASAIVKPDSIMTSAVPAAFWTPLPGLYTLSYFTSLTARDRLEGEREAGGTLPQVALPMSMTSGVSLNSLSLSATASRPTLSKEDRQNSYTGGQTLLLPQ